jgi:hypothetical protein
VIDRLSGAYGRLLAGLALVGCAILMAMMVIIVADVALRNIAVPGLPRGLAWSNEISELMLYPCASRRGFCARAAHPHRHSPAGSPQPFGTSNGWAT